MLGTVWQCVCHLSWRLCFLLLLLRLLLGILLRLHALCQLAVISAAAAALCSCSRWLLLLLVCWAALPSLPLPARLPLLRWGRRGLCRCCLALVI
jgi:hypothetical protein